MKPELGKRLLAPLWLLRGAVTGLCTGGAIALFLFMIGFVTRLRIQNPWLFLLLPGIAALTAWTYGKIGKALDKGTTLTIDAINDMIVSAVNPSLELVEKEAKNRHRVPFRLAPVVFISTIGAHLAGASAGKEGAGVQIGSAIAGGISRFERYLVGLFTKKRHAMPSTFYTDNDTGLYLICGAGAAFGSLFNAPIAGTLFGMQVASPRINRLEALAPCLTASFVACWISIILGSDYHSFIPVIDVALSFGSVIKVLIVSVGFGLFSQLFCHTTALTKKLVGKIKTWEVKAAVAATVLLVLTVIEYLIFHDTPFNGLGLDLVDKAYAESLRWWFPFGKLLFTALTLAASLRGGEVVPLIVCGATLGSAVAPLVALPPSMMAMCGAMATLAGATKLPVVCFMLGLEFFGSMNPALLFLSCSVGYLTSGAKGIYEKQLR